MMYHRTGGFEAHERQIEHRRKGVWTPVSVGLMVIGFVVFWPIGLAILAHNIWARPGDAQRWFNRYIRPTVDSARGSDDRIAETWRGVDGDARSFFEEMREGWRRWKQRRR